MKLNIHSQTSMVQPLKFGNGCNYSSMMISKLSMLEKESQMTLDIEAWRKVLQLTKILLVIIIETGFHADLT